MYNFNTYINYNLGDSIFAIDYLIKVVKKNKDITFHHHAPERYFGEIRKLIYGFEDRIHISPYHLKPSDSINLWIDDEWWFNQFVEKKNENNIYPIDLDEAFIERYKIIEEKFGIPNPIQNSNDFLLEFPDMDNYDLPKKYDLLIINSSPQSGQYVYEWELFEKLINENLNKKIITTLKIPGVECTLDYGYDLINIAKISTKVKNIVSVNTGVITLCLNKITLSNVDNFYVLDNMCSYSYKKIKHSKTLLNIKL